MATEAPTAPRLLRRPRRLIGAVCVLSALAVAGGLAFERDGSEPGPAPISREGRATIDPLTAATGELRAIEELQATLRAHPNDAHAHGELGVAYLQRARETSDPALYSKAGALFEQGLAIDPADLSTLLGAGSLALSLHDFRGAVPYAEKALAETQGFSPAALAILGDAQVELGRYDEGFATFQRLVETRPSLVAYARQSYAQELQGDLPLATQLMQSAVTSGSGAPENTEWTRIQLANLLIAQGQLDRAEGELRHALAVLPSYARAEAGLGAVAVARGDLAGAEEWYAKAATHLPLPEIVGLLGDVRAARGDAKGAADAYALYRVQEELFRQAGGQDDLEMSLFEASHPDSGGPSAAATVAQARRALAARPSVTAHDALGWALFRAGDCSAALVEARAATALGTRSAPFLYHRGAIAACAGDTADARRSLTVALAGNPRFHPLDAPAAQTLLDDLGGPLS